jgi:hypothetical protein
VASSSLTKGPPASAFSIALRTSLNLPRIQIDVLGDCLGREVGCRAPGALRQALEPALELLAQAHGHRRAVGHESGALCRDVHNVTHAPSASTRAWIERSVGVKKPDAGRVR